MRIQLSPAFAAIFMLLPALFLSIGRVEAATLAVDSTCSLADAIKAANDDTATGGCSAGSGADVISLSANVTLTGVLPTITSEVVLEGSNYTLSGDEKFPGVVISGAKARLQNLTVTKASINTFGAGIYVYNGELTLNNVKLVDNSAGDLGGGIYASESKVTVTDSEIKNNETKRSHGGGIYFVSTDKTHELDISGSILSSNESAEDGGALKIAGGVVTIKKTTFNSNSADEGGAIESNDATLTVENSTFSANTAREGGGLSAFGSKVTLTHTTWSLNSADEQGGAIAIIGWSGWLKMRNTLITDSAKGGDCDSGPNPDIITQFKGNFIRDGSCMTPTPTPTGFAGINAQSAAGTPEPEQAVASAVDDALAQVEAQNAPSTLTLTAQSDPKISAKLTGTPAMHRLNWGSQVIDAAATEHCLRDDQADTTRPQITGCDIGAHEVLRPTPEPTGAAAAQVTDTPIPPVSLPQPTDDDTPPDNQPPDDQPPDSQPPGGQPPGVQTPGGQPPGGQPPGSPQATPTATVSAPPSGCVHTVVAGDTLYSLAQHYGTTVDAFRRVNQLISDSLQIGQQLLVPVSNCSPGPYICVIAADTIVVESANGYIQCLEVNTNRLDKHAALAPGMIAAVEIRGFVNPGSRVCFKQAGTVVFLDTITSPPQASTLSSYDDAGWTCAAIDRPGVVVLVAPQTEDAEATAKTSLIGDDTRQTLTNCLVTTTDAAKMTDSPTSDNVIGLVPFGVTLSADARSADRYDVAYLGGRGWISADSVQAQGDCA